MDQKADKLIADQALIYESHNGVVYARYRDPPHNKKPRWVIGGKSSSLASLQGRYLDYREWQQLCDLADSNSTLKSQLEKLINLYYIVKEDA